MRRNLAWPMRFWRCSRAWCRALHLHGWSLPLTKHSCRGCCRTRTRGGCSSRESSSACSSIWSRSCAVSSCTSPSSFSTWAPCGSFSCCSTISRHFSVNTTSPCAMRFRRRASSCAISSSRPFPRSLCCPTRSPSRRGCRPSRPTRRRSLCPTIRQLCRQQIFGVIWMPSCMAVAAGLSSTIFKGSSCTETAPRRPPRARATTSRSLTRWCCTRRSLPFRRVLGTRCRLSAGPAWRFSSS
mmetsp:Transcript_48432/g.71007  ORF Transcript_48432/g.71007 Transcript_48432/m.71007 type:complete len:240 (+) Transcript_48432:3282-4001(+)